jgi:hypothetical protein
MITVEQSQRIFQLVAPLKTICAWCRRTMSDGPSGPVSHGLCGACAEQLEQSGAK